MTKSERNPSWTRDELLVALDYYLDNSDDYFSPASQGVIELTAKIGQVAKALGLAGSETLRNANGVSMKLMNFRSHDPHHSTKGLSRGNKLEEVIWAEFANHPDTLKRAVSGILEITQASTGADAPFFWTDDIDEAKEGRLLTRMHRVRERNSTLVRKKKASFFEQNGHLRCEACSFDFENTYGKRGEGFIECHHTKPVSELSSGETTKLTDLVLLCSNCHRMVHAARPWWTLEELKLALSS